MIPVTHKLEIYKEDADAILSGEKTFEIRLNDRHYMLGDKVHFYKVSAGRPVEHPITDKLYEITYISYGNGLGWGGLRKDWCAFTIKESEEKAEK